MTMTTEHEPFAMGAPDNATCPHCGTAKGEIDRGKLLCIQHDDGRSRPRSRVADDFDAIGQGLAALRAERDAIISRGETE
jgi:hypothetical protein